jgi:hypothetical protein
MMNRPRLREWTLPEKAVKALPKFGRQEELTC